MISAGTFIVKGPDGSDQISSIEFLQFDNGMEPVALPINPVYRFFQGQSNDHFYTLSASEAQGLRDNPNSGYSYEGIPWATPSKGAGTIDTFRFYSTANGEHFLTTSANERDLLIEANGEYRYEGVAFQTFDSTAATFASVAAGLVTLERFYNTNSGAHHFSASTAETQFILGGGAGPGWRDEGKGFIVSPPA